ncbi:MAG: PDZ domain-containing protein [Acidobacteriota bacterium]|nr:PDZ domain-containing protein [Acidobacteriota bacterium]
MRQAALAAVLAAGSGPVNGMAQAPPQQRARSAYPHTEVSRGYLGVGVLQLTEERSRALHLKDESLIKNDRLDENGPAAKAGIRANDVILEVNGKPVEDIQQFQRSIGDTAPGARVNLTLWRNGARETIAVTVDQRPGNFFLFGRPELPDAPMPPMPEVPFNGGTSFPAIPDDAAVVGFYGESVNGQLAEYFGVKQGVLVHSVKAGTPARRSGLKSGDVVVKVNGTPVMTPREIKGLVAASRSRSFSFTVVRDKKEMTLNVEIAGSHPDPGDRVAL